MANKQYCEKCGAELQPGDKFCQGCGAKVEAAPPAAPVASAGKSVAPPPPQAPTTPQSPTAGTGAAPVAPIPNPAAVPVQPAPEYPVQPNHPVSSPPSSLNPVTLGIGIAVILAIAFGAWWFGFRKFPAETKTEATVVTTSTKPAEPETSVEAAATSQEFVGKWFSRDGSEEVAIDIALKNGLLIGTVRGQKGHFELTPANSPKLKGFSIDGSEKIPITAEINSDKTQIVVTVLYPESEPDTAVLHKDTGPPPDEPKTTTRSAPTTQAKTSKTTTSKPKTNELDVSGIDGIETIKDYTSQHAQWLVEDLPEVKAWMTQVQKAGGRAVVSVEPEDAKTWSVHVYEIVDDGGPGHTATFGWYKVDRKSGKVTEGM